MSFDKQRALEVIEFVQLLNLTDDFYGQPFVLQDWQHKIIWDVYGTVNEKGLRQYQYAYLEIPKKNGKTTLIAALGLYHLAMDAPGGQIYCCAADKEQAGLAYNAAIQMIEQNEELKEICKIVDSKKLIINTQTGTFLKVLSAEAYTKHGINPTVVIFDELHAQPNRELWDVMTFGAGAARKEPLWWVITTAGDDPDRHSIGWEQHEYARKVRDGELVDPYWYVKMYNAPEDCDIFDEKIWFQVNPSLGVSIDIDKVRREAIGARNDPAKEKLFRWLRLNQWVSLKRIGWLPLTLWDSTIGKWSPAELVGKKCYIGLDLSSTGDLTGACALFPPQDGFDDWRSIYECWIPEESMNERIKRDGAPYDRFVREKHLIATPGNAVDYEFVEARLLAMNKLYDVQALCPDPWNSQMLTQRLDKAGMTIIEVPQTIASLSPAMKEQERLMKTGQYTHENHPVARWCFGNVIVAVDGNGNIKPMKNKSIEKIDLAVAEINAMAVAMVKENDEPVYSRRGMRSLL
jgi:phage terminase large subunit-like protein